MNSESHEEQNEDGEKNLGSGQRKLWVQKTAQPQTVHTCEEDNVLFSVVRSFDTYEYRVIF